MTASRCGTPLPLRRKISPRSGHQEGRTTTGDSLRNNGRTLCPRSVRYGVKWLPTSPVAPDIRMFIRIPFAPQRCFSFRKSKFLVMGGPTLANGTGTYVWATWLFLRSLGLVYLTAFVSYGVQVKGLIGR